MEKIIAIVCSTSVIFLSSLASGSMLLKEKNMSLESVKSETPRKQTFHTQFLGKYGVDYDFESLSSGLIKPGVYYLTLYVNNRKLSSERILFAEKEGRVIPCFDINTLLLANVDGKFLNEMQFADNCVDIADVIAGANAEYNDEESALSISVPQKYLLYANANYINPELWDDGVTAFKMSTNSNLSSFSSRNQGAQQSFYTGIQASLNVGAWRFNTRDNIYLSNAAGGSELTFAHNELYAYRAIRSLQSKLSIGNLYTSGDFFDSTSLTGVTLATNDQMLPFSMRSYVPRIQGIAESNATVTLTQGGSVIYETQVPPGEFVLNDFYPAHGQDIQVNIRESDGRISSFNVPYSSVPQLLRQGYQRYSSTVGELRNSHYKHSPLLFEGTYQYGVDNNATLYGGVQYTTTDYQAFKVGTALNTPVGAFSSDLTRSFITDKNNVSDDCKGFCNTAVQLSYNRLFDETSTGVNASVKKTVGKGYASLADAMFNQSEQQVRALRSRFDLSLSQSFPGKWGGVYVGGQMARYWNNHSRHSEKTFQTSYRNSYNRLNYSLSLIERNGYFGQKDRQVYLNFSLPLHNDAKSRASLLVSGGYSSSGAALRTAVSGSAGEQNQYGFNTYINTRRGEVFSGGGSLTQNSDAYTATASIGQSASGTSYGLGLNSGLVVHAGGVNFSQGMGSSVAVIHAPDAVGTKIRPDQRAEIKSNDFGILRNLYPYQYNEIYLDPEGSGFGIDTGDFSKRVVPTEGAVLFHKAESQNKPMKLFQINYPEEKIPFGTVIKDSTGEMVSLLGQNSSAMLPYTKENSRFIASWREDEVTNTCVMTFESTEVNSDLGHLSISNIDCIPSVGGEND